MNKCKIIDCNNNVFGGQLCKYHQFQRHMRGGDLYKPKPRLKNKLSKESPKRKKEHISYIQKIKAFWEESVKNKTNYCFFCNELMSARENVHHVRGRGNLYLEEQYWVHAHNSCHVDYHFRGNEWLRQQEWYDGFMERLKNKDDYSYRKELRKGEKVNKLNPRKKKNQEEDLF
jgi:hypothetical protein